MSGTGETGGTGFVAPPVQRVRRIVGRRFGEHFREKYRHPLRKALSFVTREGPAATLRKYRSKLVEKRIEAEAAIVVARFAAGGLEYIGFTRSLGGPYVFPLPLVFRLTEAREPEDVAVSEAALLALESYLPVASCPLPPGLAAEILGCNAFLQPLEADGALAPFRVGTEPAAGGARAAPAGGRPGVYLLGFGGYVREQVLPCFPGQVALALDYRADLIARHDRSGVPLTARFDEVLERLRDEAEPRVIVSTYHSDHAPMAVAVLEANPAARVFIEKPPCVTPEEAEALIGWRERGAWIDVGFNRRYARLTGAAKELTRRLPKPLVVTALVKELKLPPTHWYFWPNQGTRVTGNACHWLDLACHLIEEPPVEVTLLNAGDTVSIAVSFRDGSLATIVATDHGDDLPGVTEQVEVRGGETTLTIHDFRRLEVRSGAGAQVHRSGRREKGHARMYADLRRRWESGGAPRYPVEDLRRVTRLTAAASAMLGTGERARVLETGE